MNNKEPLGRTLAEAYAKSKQNSVNETLSRIEEDRLSKEIQRKIDAAVKKAIDKINKKYR